MAYPIPPHLLAYVDYGYFPLHIARAIAAYAGDVERCKVPALPGDRRTAFRREAGGAPDPAAEQARKRANDARALMGKDQAAVMYRVGVRGDDIGDAARELGYGDRTEVELAFKRAARNLLMVYG